MSVNDMWRMVWQHNVDKIVMLTNLMDQGKVMNALQTSDHCPYFQGERS